MPAIPALQVIVPQHTCVTGQSIKGTAALNLRAMRRDPLDEVQVELRGRMRIGYPRRQKEDILLVYETKSIWKRSSGPSPETRLLTIPFDLALPSDVPPSCYVSAGSAMVLVEYKVEAVGVRVGASRPSLRVDCGLKVVAPDCVGAPIKARLKGGWHGPWATKTVRRRIRRGLWGHHADVQLEFTYPATPVLPLSTPIPFALSVVTVSRPLPRTYDKRLWPYPPSQPREVKFSLRQSVHVRSSAFDRMLEIPMSSLWGSVDIERLQDEWYPLDGDGVKGRWKQETVFSSVFRLRCPPAFRFSRLGYEVEIQYLLYVKVRFGRFHNMSATIPIVVASGMTG